MEFWEAVRSRRSIRLFEDAPIPADKVARLIAAAVAAPSARNASSAHMHVATGETLHQVRRAMAMGTVHLGEYLDVLPPEHLAQAESFFGTLGNAPMAVAVSVPLTDDDLSRINAYLSAGAAMENMLLAAVAEGLGGCSVTASFFVRDALMEIFGLGADREILLILLFGRPAETPAAPAHDPDIVTFHE